MQIRKVSRDTFDVFGDTGFDNWTRIHRFHWGYKVVNGVRLPKELMTEVVAKLQQYPHGSIQNV